MIVKLNDTPHEIAKGTTLAVFIEGLGLKPQGIAVAIAYEMVPKDKWDDTVLTEGVELMLIHAVSGG